MGFLNLLHEDRRGIEAKSERLASTIAKCLQIYEATSLGVVTQQVQQGVQLSWRHHLGSAACEGERQHVLRKAQRKALPSRLDGVEAAVIRHAIPT